jgi:tyrosinase
MTIPKEAELLGATSGELQLKGSRLDTVVRLSPEGERKLAALANDASSRSVYLGLENIRGTFDAAVLNTYINLPEGARPADHRDRLAESVGLYGLRRASMAQDENAGVGLTFLLEITRILTPLVASHSLKAGEIRVTIMPDPPLAEPIVIAIGRISIFAVP